MKKTLLVFLFFFSNVCLPVLCQAQDAFHANQKNLRSPVQSLTVENGLPQGFIRGIVQDKQGFIWMATKGGLVRYDGYATKVFKNDPADSTTLSSNIINYLYYDRQNRIWIVYASRAIDIFNPVTQSVKHISPDSALGWFLKEPLHFGMYQDSKFRYWVISTEQKKLYYFSMRHKDSVEIPLPKGEAIIGVQESARKEIWFSTNKALYKFQRHSLKKVADLPKDIHFRGGSMSSMVQDQNGNWIIGNMGCVEVYNPDSQKWQIVRTPFPNTVILLLIKAPDGKIYFNAANKVYRLNADYSLTILWTNPLKPGDLQAMMVDRSNVLWLGTDSFGARLINLSSVGFHSFPYQYGFIFDVLRSLHYPLHHLPDDGHIVSYYSRTARDKKDNVWLINLTVPNDLSRIPSGYLPVFKLSNDPSVVHIKTKYSSFLQITFDEHGQCWAIAMDTTFQPCYLVKVDLKEGHLVPETTLNYHFKQISYLTTFQKKICIVYRNAIQFYDPQTKKSVFYTSKEKFGNAALLMATPDKYNDSILWISGIGNGLIKLNATNGKVSSFTENDGIPNNTIYAAITDKHGYLWCSSNKGIFRFDPLSHKVLSFTARDGLQGNEFNRYHFLHMPGGRIFFGGTLGWTVFYPDSIHSDAYQPPTVITDIKVNNEPLVSLPQWEDSIITTMKTLTLPYYQNFLTFNFAGLEFNQPGKLPYRYQLTGINQKWVESGKENAAHYTNLPPGDYTFKVNAGNTSGMWSDSVKTMKVVILPPWWKTWWAYLVYCLLVLLAGYVFYRYRMSRLQLKHKMILQQKETTQLKLMDEMKSRFFSNITHEFKTPLSLIISPLEQINKDRKTSPAIKKKLSGIQHNANQLLHLINQLLDLSKIEANSMRISLSRGDLHQFLKDIVLVFEGQAFSKNIQLHFNSTVQGNYLFDTDKWQKIFSNLLSNAIKFTPEEGIINIRLSEIRDSTHNIQLVVQDTGIGIPKDKLPHIFDRFYQIDDSFTKSYGGTGIGLAVTKELTELMGGNIEVESPYENTDDPSTYIKGTLFRISLPVKKAGNEKHMSIRKIERDIELQASTESATKKQAINKDAPLVLIVEDHKDLNRFISETLEKTYRILKAYNGKEGLQIANETLPDIIISDIMMPEMDGYTFCKAIKRSELTCHIAFVILSAKGSQESVIHGLENFADDYVAKPFYPDELLLRIANLCDRQKKLKAYYYRQLSSPSEEIDMTSLKDSFLEKIYGIIDDNLDQKYLNVETLSEKMTMNRRTLNRKLEMTTGLSAGKLIKQYRLKKAAQLLRSGHNASETAYMTGFETPSYFSVSFKNFYGVSPSEYTTPS